MASRAQEYHPDSGYGVVPDPYHHGYWQVRWWDGQTGESRYCIADIRERKVAEWLRDSIATEYRK